MSEKNRKGSNSKQENETFLEEKEKNPEQINYQLWISIFSAINVMLLILCILTGVFMHTEDDRNILDADLCVRCTELKIHQDDQLQNVLMYEGDICCVKPGHLEEFVHAFSDVWKRKKLSKENPSYRDCRVIPEESPKPAIKLTGAHFNNKDKNTIYVRWDEEEFNLNTDVLHYSHGKIVVKKDGTFFIYAQIEFLCDLNKRKYMDSLNYNVMQVARLPIKGPEEIIMKTSSTPSDCNNTHTASYTSHVGTTLQLFEGDYISAKVFCWDTIRNHSSASFFGMHKVE